MKPKKIIITITEDSPTEGYTYIDVDQGDFTFFEAIGILECAKKNLLDQGLIENDDK